MKISRNTLNIGRKKDPSGFFVAVLDEEAYSKLSDYIQKLGQQVVVDRAGTLYIVKSRSWSILERLANVARQRGVQVEERRE